MLRWLSAGESHGPSMGVILEGLPAGFELDLDELNRQLHRRQQGYGRGGRQRIEQDEVTVLSGLRHGRTLGSPLLLLVPNKDHRNWEQSMSPASATHRGKVVRVPRPGHADWAGAVKYGHRDMRDVLERASARETVNRVLSGAVARQLLLACGIQTGSHVIALAGRSLPMERQPAADTPADELGRLADASCLRVIDKVTEEGMCRLIDNARESGDTVGGIAELRATGLPIGLGSHVHWDRRLDGLIGAGMLSLPAVKGVEIGPAFENARMHGRQVMDAILPDENGLLKRQSNRMGGLEGGITNGETLQVRLAMKPLPTLRKALPSVNLDSGEACSAHRERSDICALPALSVAAEHSLNWILLGALLDCCPADSWPVLETAVRQLRGRPRAILGEP